MFQFRQLERRGLKNYQVFHWMGFESCGLREYRDGAILYQLSYEATHWERGQFIGLYAPTGSEMM